MNGKILGLFAFALFGMVLLSGCMSPSINTSGNNTNNTNGTITPPSNVTNETTILVYRVAENSTTFWGAWASSGAYLKCAGASCTDTIPAKEEQIVKDYYKQVYGIQIKEAVNEGGLASNQGGWTANGYHDLKITVDSKDADTLKDDGWTIDWVAPYYPNNSMPNPASASCVGRGFNDTIETDANGGQYGVCSKPGYTECEEWAFFNGACHITKANQSIFVASGSTAYLLNPDSSASIESAARSACGGSDLGELGNIKFENKTITVSFDSFPEGDSRSHGLPYMGSGDAVIDLSNKTIKCEIPQ